MRMIPLTKVWAPTTSKMEDFVAIINGFQTLIMISVAICMGPRSDLDMFSNSDTEMIKHRSKSYSRNWFLD